MARCQEGYRTHQSIQSFLKVRFRREAEQSDFSKQKKHIADGFVNNLSGTIEILLPTRDMVLFEVVNKPGGTDIRRLCSIEMYTLFGPYFSNIVGNALRLV